MTAYAYLHGIAQHAMYHAGQVAILKKLAGRATERMTVFIETGPASPTTGRRCSGMGRGIEGLW